MRITVMVILNIIEILIENLVFFEQLKHKDKELKI